MAQGERRPLGGPTASPLLPPPVVVHHDLCYHPDGEAHAHVCHHLDVYAPDGCTAGSLRPTLVFLHGGGWRNGDRRSRFGFFQNVGEHFAKQGFVVVLPSYRKSLRLSPLMLGVVCA